MARKCFAKLKIGKFGELKQILWDKMGYFFVFSFETFFWSLDTTSPLTVAYTMIGHPVRGGQFLSASGVLKI